MLLKQSILTHRRKQMSLFLAVLSGSIALATSPGWAAPIDKISDIGSYFSPVTWNNYFSDIQNTIKDYIPEVGRQAIDNELGGSKVAVDTLLIRHRAKQNFDKKQLEKDAFGTEITLSRLALAKEVDNTNIWLRANSLISARGQTAIENHTNNVVKPLMQRAHDRAVAAQSMDVTQDVMKELVKIQDAQTQLMGDMRLEQFHSRIDTQYTNIALVNISRSLEEMNQVKRTQSAANVGYLLMMLGYGAR